MAGRDDLVSLPPIPEPERQAWLDAVLTSPPEERARIEEAQQRDDGERAVAYATVRAIYQHYATGAPSRHGLVVVLRAFADILDEGDASTRGGR